VVAQLMSVQIARPAFAWLVEGRAPSEREVALVLRHPLSQMKISAKVWLAATVAFGVLNAAFSPPTGAVVAVTVLLGGTTTCALVYLVAERTLRPITARALRHAPPRRPVHPGVAARVLLGWAFTTAVPLLGLALLAVSVAAGSAVSSTRIAVTVLFLTLAALVAGALAMVIAAKSLAEPLRSLRAALAHVEVGRLDVDVDVDDGSEVGLVQAGFNQMVAGLRERERLRDLFDRHVGEEVAREALERGVALGGELCDAGVLFVDLIGSTELASRRPAPDVVALLNRFFAIVVDVVRAHGGWVNKFEGDGALCVFGVPVPVDDAAGRALAAARELERRLAEELPGARAGIAVSAGSVVAGHIGAEDRLEYTVIGDAVNEAARLVDLAKRREPRVVASGAAVRAAGEEAGHWALDGEATLRGRDRPTQIAQPVS